MRGWTLVQTKRLHICCLFKWENALVEANQLQMQSAEAVTRLGEACQDVKVFFFFTGFSWKVPWVAANLSCHCHRLRPKYPHQMKSIRCAHDCLVVLRPGSKQAQRRKSMWKVNILLMLWHIRESSSWILCTCPQTHRSQSTLKVQIQASTERRAFTPCRDPDVVNSEQLLYIFREAIKTEKTTCSALTHMTLSPFSTCQGQVPLISFQINQDDTLLLKDSC